MKVLTRVDITYRQVSPFLRHCESYRLNYVDPKTMKTVPYVLNTVVTVDSVDKLNKKELFNLVPGLENFISCAFAGKEILFLTPTFVTTIDYIRG